MTVDGLNALKLEYNSLNLTAGVRNAANNAPLATYRWLADGTKTGVRDATSSQGFEYIGSLIYRRNANDELELESTAFGGGRITASEGSNGKVYTPNYFIADHLGSTRAIVTPNATGGYTVPERNNYLPFGKRWENPTAQISDNRWLYNGKELQTIGLSDAMQFLDYGARIYDPHLGRWINPDPLSEISRRWTTYNYAWNNPLRFIDPDGRWAGEYYNERGLYLGSDGIDDDKIYVIRTMQTTDQMYGNRPSEQKGNSNPISEAQAIISETLISDFNIFKSDKVHVTEVGTTTEINAAMATIGDDGTRGTLPINNREYGGNFDGEGGVNNLTRSSVKDPAQTQPLVLRSDNGLDYHSHPSGVKSAGNGESGIWPQPPSKQDISVAPAAGTGRHVVFGMRNQRIYIYDRSGVLATIPMSVF